jgi:hypothetical protein
MARTLGYSPVRKPIPRKPQPTKIVTLESQLSALRSQTAVWDLSSNTATGRKIDELVAAIKKKPVML